MTSCFSRRRLKSAKHWKSWSRKRWKACTSSPYLWSWKSASDPTGGIWTESPRKLERVHQLSIREQRNQLSPASQNAAGISHRADLSARTGTPYGTSPGVPHSAEEIHMLRWLCVVDWGEPMRRICEILFISALVGCFAGCSGLSDVKNSGSGSGSGQATGVTVSPGTATVDLFKTQSFSAQ